MILIYKVINIITYEVYKKNLISHADIRKMHFGLTVLVNELSKFIMLLILFTLFDQLSLFMFSFIVLLSIRTFSGGLHQNSNIKCFLISLFFFSLTVGLPNIIQLDKTISLYLLGSSLILIYLFSPMTSSFRPISSKKRRQVMRYIAVFFTLLWSLIIYLNIDDPIFFTAGVLTIALQAIQLVIGKGEKIMENTSLKNKVSNSMLIGVATLAIMLAKLLTQSASFLLWGETKCPKSLLK